MDTKLQILDLIRAGHTRAGAIAKELNVSRPAVSYHVRELLDEGKILKNGRDYVVVAGNEGKQTSIDAVFSGNETADLGNEGSDSFNEGSGSFNEGSGSFNEGSGSFNEQQVSFNEGSGSFNEGSGSFNEQQVSFNEGSGSFNEAPDSFNEGPGSFNEAQPNDGVCLTKLNEAQPNSGGNAAVLNETANGGNERKQTAVETFVSGNETSPVIEILLESNHEFSAFALANLTEHKITRCNPGTYPHPGYKFKDKRQFRSWCASKETNHLFYNLAEGLNPHQRVSKENPPQFLHGIVADYDADLGEGDLHDLVTRTKGKLLPAFGSRTFSGGARLVWLFATPMPIHSQDILKRTLTKARAAIGATVLLPGLDEGAYLDPCRYFECGTRWQDLGGSPIGADQIWHWIESASRKKDFRRAGEVIPLEKIEKAVQERFPGRWSGPFGEGVRGVRFWDPGADALSVIVRESGCQCFTGDKPFMTWAEIFGRDFVEHHQKEKIGGAIRDLYYDGRNYWRQLPDRSWQAMNATTAARHLRVEFDIDPETYGQPASELDRVLHQIEQQKSVVGAMPFVHRKATLIYLNRKPYLNIATARCIKPAEAPQQWGENFPFIADYLRTLFAEEPLTVFLAWLKRFYKSAYEGSLLKGQAVFVAGPAGVGKTLLSEGLVAPLVGGKQEATDFLLGGSNFNKELFEYALWTIDDDPVSGDHKVHLRFSNLVKKVAANHTFNYHAKFRDQLTVPWNGRVLVTCNDDPESIRILPDLDVSIKDKLILLKVTDAAKQRFPANVMQILAAELPFFARWLLDFEVPIEVVGDARFGVVSYIDIELEEIARQSSVANSFAEILDLWRKNYFGTAKSENSWSGTSAELHSAMVTDETIKPLVQGSYTTTTIGRHLCAMINRGYIWISQRRCRGDGRRTYFVFRDGAAEVLRAQTNTEENIDENPF